MRMRMRKYGGLRASLSRGSQFKALIFGRDGSQADLKYYVFDSTCPSRCLSVRAGGVCSESMAVRWPRVLTSTQLSEIIKRQKNPLTALQVFREAKTKYTNYRYNGPVYATMINILGNSGQISEMKEVIVLMKGDSCECKDSVFAAAIKTYASHGLLDEAISLFRNLRQFNCVNWTHSFNTLLQLMVDESKLEAAHRLFVEFSYGWEMKSRIKSSNLLMSSLCQRGRSDLALNIFQEMNYQGCYPDRESYRILMEGLCDDGRLNEAVHLLYSMFWRISQKGCGEDIVIYRTLLYALCNNGLVEQALEILGKILRKGLKSPKRFNQSLDLNLCNNGENTEGIKCLINEALIRGGTPSSASYSSVAIDLYNEGNISEADRAVNHMKGKGFKPTDMIYEVKMEALTREGKIEEAMKAIEELKKEGNCLPSTEMYNSLMTGLCKNGQSVMASEYLEKMEKQVGRVANEKSYRIVIEGLCSENLYGEASGVMEKMVRRSYWPCRNTYKRLIKGLCSVKMVYEAVIWVEEMLSEGKLPQLCVWNALVSSVCFNTSSIKMWEITVEQLVQLDK